MQVSPVSFSANTTKNQKRNENIKEGAVLTVGAGAAGALSTFAVSPDYIGGVLEVGKKTSIQALKELFPDSPDKIKEAVSEIRQLKTPAFGEKTLTLLSENRLEAEFKKKNFEIQNKFLQKMGVNNIKDADESINAIKRYVRKNNALKLGAIAAGATALIYTGYKLLTGQGKESNQA